MKYLIAIAIILTTPAFAEETDRSAVVSIAEDYLAAYSSYDIAAIEPFLADDMVFYDPTSSNQNADGGPFRFNGKQAVLKGLGDFAGQFASFSVHYNVERRYESQGVVVFVAQLAYNGSTQDGQQFEGSAPIVTAVTVQDGKVVNHTDYYDYDSNVVNFTNK